MNTHCIGHHLCSHIAFISGECPRVQWHHLGCGVLLLLQLGGRGGGQPPGKVRSSQVATVPAARLPDTLEERREGDGIVHFAGIVGTGLTLRGAHMVLPWSDRVLVLVCFVCGCIKRRHGNSVG